MFDKKRNEKPKDTNGQPLSKFEQYVEERFKEQMEWYDGKAIYNKGKHFLTRKVVIVASALTPVLITLSHWIGNEYVALTMAGLSIGVSALVAIISSFADTFRYHEDWIQKRKANEKLKREYYHFMMRIGGYKNLEEENAQLLFVEKIEDIINDDITQFVQGEYNTEKKFKQNLKEALAEVKPLENKEDKTD